VPFDALVEPLALTTSTNGVTGTWIDTLTGTGKSRGFAWKMQVFSYLSAITGAVYSASIECGDDGTNAIKTITAYDPITAGTAAATIEHNAQFHTGHRYLRFKLTVSPTTNSQTIALRVEHGLSTP
jgi:hypothetical protein